MFLAGALPSARAARALQRFVEGGGGLWVAPGPRLRSRALDRRLGSLLPARLSPARAAPTTPGLSLGEGAIGLRQADFAGAHLGRYLPLEQIEPGARVWLRLGDGHPLLVEGTRGRGRVAVLATSLGDRLGDLPYQPGYLPLVLKICQRLAERGTSVPETVVAGSTLQLGRGRPGQQLEVELPSGAVQPVNRDGAFDHTDSIGLYRVRSAESGAGTDLAFAVVAPSEEGDLSPDHPPDSIEQSTASQDTGRMPARPLAPWLYLLAGVLVALEGILRASRPSSFASGIAR
ncbi:MAG: hypothetical protein GXP55_00620 [Deltaproteobacteria bacterium]|nr:hypothetical protein [Deltaproteobacteria bacterium]